MIGISNRILVLHLNRPSTIFLLLQHLNPKHISISHLYSIFIHHRPSRHTIITAQAPRYQSEPTMPGPTHTAKLTLTYPLYCADFDPQNSDFLLVGGGGGEGRSGVSNKIVRAKSAPKEHVLTTIPHLDTVEYRPEVRSIRSGGYRVVPR